MLDKTSRSCVEQCIDTEEISLAHTKRLISQGSAVRTAGTACLVGGSSAFRQLLNTIDAVAGNGCVVLLEGESGTGKELLALRIHENSPRSGNPFIPVNCPAVAESLFESQFYGHVKGSFTGAQGDTLGMVRAAEGGTLFLDEIGELPLHLQPKLLRLLQEKEVTPVGGTKAIRVNVRFVAATNRSLARAVAQGQFRRDLYHRLNIVRIQIPPLRHRPDDIKLLLDYYLDYYAAEYDTAVRKLDDDVYESLLRYSWPGNVRELCGWVESLYAANIPAVPPGGDIWDDHYATGNTKQPVIAEAVARALEYTHSNEKQTATIATPKQPLPIATQKSIEVSSLAETEANAISQALLQSKNNRSIAAKLLNIHRTTLLRKMKLYGIE